MKKLLAIVFILIVANMPASAITSDESVSVEYIKKRGHSDEMARLVDLQKSRINGTEPTYINPDPEWYKSDKRVNFVRKMFMYFDPGLDNGKFMHDNIDYTNRWDDI